MKSKIFNLDWEKFDYQNKDQRLQLGGAMQYFLALPNKFVPGRFEKVQEFVKTHKQIQEFTLMSDGYANEKAIDVIEKLHLLTDYDNGYEQIFDVRDFSGTKASGFDVAVSTSGLVFDQVLPGEKAKVYQAAAGKYRTFFCWYAAALGWHRELFTDGDWWTIEDNAIEFRNAAYSHRAATYYALLETAADTVGCCSAITSDCTDCSADARGIMDSINFAARSIVTNVSGRYGINPATTEFIILTPLALRGRVRQALGVQTQQYEGSTKIADFSYRVITSTMLTNANRVMVILPKRTLKIGYRMDLTLFDDFDILSMTDTVAGWMRHGGSVGDLDQIACIEFTAESGSCPNTASAPVAACGDIVDQNGDAVTGLPNPAPPFVPAT